MKTIVMVAAALALTVSPALAKSRFQAYEARDAVTEGQGGTKISKNGIDYWTTGTPPRRYKILGIINDKRSTGVFAGDAIGSKSVAEAALENGGDAVIFLDQRTQITGSVTNAQVDGYGNQIQGSAVTTPLGKAFTTLAVIKYLD